MKGIRKLATALSYPEARRATAWAAVLYLVLYLFLIGDLSYSSEPLTASAPSLRVLEDWPSLIFRERISFNYESVAAFYATNNFVFLLSPANLFLGGVLAILVGLNIGFLAFALKRPKVCGAPSRSGLLASIPGLFLGFACCAPTILIALGSAAASISFGFLAARTIFYPVAFFGLLLSLWFNLRQMRVMPVSGGSARKVF